MNINSISTKITFVFVFTFFLFLATFIFYVQYEKKQVDSQAGNYYQNISNHFMKNRFQRYEVIEYMKNLNFELEQNPHPILENGKIVFAKRGFEAVLYKNNYYLHVVAPRFRILFKDLRSYERSYFGYIFFGLVFIMLVSLYIWLIKSLRPLQNLKEEIFKFSKGDFNIDCKSEKKDEIADVANEFDSAAKKISLLLNSRQLFLRTIMHELKTPIAKGRIVSELIDDEKQKNRMITIFERLNLLIDDFAKVEQVISNNYVANVYSCSIKSIVNRSIDILMLEDTSSVSIENISNKKLNVDLELISLAIKNLLDNGLKYSHENKVIIKEEADCLSVISKGKKLEKPLEEYFEPFHNDTHSKSHGMGLGLYIVYSILKMHSMKLEYEYKENHNYFKVIYFR